MKRFFTKLGPFLCSWGFLKFVLWAVTLIVLLYAEEDWRGTRMWAATKAEWEARGVSFNPQAYIPPVVPDDQNLGTIPLFKLEPDPKQAGALVPMRLRRALDSVQHGFIPIPPGPKLGLPPDFETLRVEVAAAYARVFKGSPTSNDSLAQLEALYPVIPELRAAAVLCPYYRLNQDYAMNPPGQRIFELVTLQIKLSQMLRLHAIIALEENRPQVALDDIKISFTLAAGLRRDPTLVAGLVDIGVIAISRSVIDHGLLLHSWNDAQLSELQMELAQIDFLSAYQATLRGEAITEVIPNFDYYGAQGLWGWWPRGWLEQNKSQAVNFMLRETGSINPGARRVLPETSNILENDVERAQELPWRLAPWNILSMSNASVFTGFALKSAQIQASVDQDQLACALERYRLAHGVYPDSLEGIVPAYAANLPHDIMSGQPYHYQLRHDGAFSLYSVGWNQKDDGGKIVYEKDSPDRINYRQGDWIWPTPH